MFVDYMLPKDASAAPAAALTAELDGYDGVWVGETQHDPFLQILCAATATSTVTVGTAVAIAFARSPMTVAYSAWDLSLYASGRFVLGLGSQVRPHIERRFSMPWSQPATRMREFVLALRAIWTTWREGTPLSFKGEFYGHDLMTPFFTPEPLPWPDPPIYLAGLGKRMTEVAGEVCDGFYFHAFTTPRYLHEVSVPALLAGRRQSNLFGQAELEGFSIAGPVFVCTGRDDAELKEAIRGTKCQIAFYASTPAYRPLLDLHGWGELQPELTALSKQGRWKEMGEAIDDEILASIAVVGEPKSAGRALRERWGGTVTRISLYAPYEADPGALLEVAAAARSAS